MNTLRRQYAVQTTATAGKMVQVLDNGNITDLPLSIPTYGMNGPVTPSGITTSNSSDNRLIPLDDTRAIMLIPTTTNFVACVVTRASDGTMTCGTSVQVWSTLVTYFAGCKIDNSRVIVSWVSGIGLYSVILSISGTTITVNTAFSFNMTGTNYGNSTVTLACMDANRVLAMIGGVLYCLAIFNTTVVINSAILSFDTYGTRTYGHTALEVIDNNSCILSLVDTTNKFLVLLYINVYGMYSSIASSIKIPLTASSPSSMVTMKKITINKYAIYSNGQLFLAIVDNVNKVITVPTIMASPSGVSGTVINLVSVSPSMVILVGYDASYYLNFHHFYVVGSNLIYIKTQVYPASVRYYYMDVIALKSDRSVLCIQYSDGTGTNVVKVACYYVSGGNYGKVLGIAQDGAGTVLLQGLSNVHSGLKEGSIYYGDLNTGIVNINNYSPNGSSDLAITLGMAISDTEILVDSLILE